MPHLAERVGSEQSDTPLLIFKIGVLGCAPLDMFERLAEDYDAYFISSDLTRRDITAAREVAGMSEAEAQDVSMSEIKRLLAEEATPMLTSGEDVVMDMFGNTVTSRRFPLTLARNAGALTVAAWINTPFELALERVQKWTDEDAFVMPVSRWAIPPVQVAKTMMNHVEWPAHEGIDYVFNLDGSTDSDDMLDQFAERMEHFGLVDEDSAE